MPSEFPSNTNKEKATPPIGRASPQKKVEKVVTGEVTQRKKPLGKRIRETFTGDDTRSVASYVMFDVMIPAAKDMVADAISQGVERKLFGEVRSRRRGSYGSSGLFGNASYHAYNRYSSGSSLRQEPRNTGSRRPQRAERFTFEEIIIPTRAEAMEVIDQMIAILSQYDAVTVNDLYELVGITGDFQNEKWGWTDLRGADIQRLRNDEYLLNLPRPEPLD